jgi:hypothetical protein
MLSEKNIARAASLIRDVRHFRNEIEVADLCPKATINIYGGVRRGECVGPGSFQVEGDRLDVVRGMLIADLRARLAIAEMDLSLLGVDPKTIGDA